MTVTLARVWRALSFWEKLKLSTSLLWTGLSLLDSDDMKKEIERRKVGASVNGGGEGEGEGQESRVGLLLRTALCVLENL